MTEFNLRTKSLRKEEAPFCLPSFLMFYIIKCPLFSKKKNTLKKSNQEETTNCQEKTWFTEPGLEIMKLLELSYKDFLKTMTNVLNELLRKSTT